jgi:hypothetical protein
VDPVPDPLLFVKKYFEMHFIRVQVSIAVSSLLRGSVAEYFPYEIRTVSLYYFICLNKELGFNSQQEQEIYSSPPSRQASLSLLASYPAGTDGSFSGSKAAGAQSLSLAPIWCHFKTVCSHISTPQYVFKEQCLIKELPCFAMTAHVGQTHIKQ